MQLEDLIGLHELTAVEFGVSEDHEDYDRGAPNAMWFILDGVTYAVIENPSDGLRSSMRDIEVSHKELSNSFAPVTVLAKYATGDYCANDILELIDTVTTKIVLRAGTHNSEDYYPSYVAEFNPENMSINIGK